MYMHPHSWCITPVSGTWPVPLNRMVVLEAREQFVRLALPLIVMLPPARLSAQAFMVVIVAAFATSATLMQGL